MACGFYKLAVTCYSHSTEPECTIKTRVSLTVIFHGASHETTGYGMQGSISQMFRLLNVIRTKKQAKIARVAMRGVIPSNACSQCHVVEKIKTISPDFKNFLVILFLQHKKMQKI
jgi:hypothetical protein